MITRMIWVRKESNAFVTLCWSRPQQLLFIAVWQMWREISRELS